MYALILESSFETLVRIPLNRKTGITFSQQKKLDISLRNLKKKTNSQGNVLGIECQLN